MAGSVLGELSKLEEQAREELAGVQSGDELQALRVRFLGRKGLLTAILRQMGSVSDEERPQIGRKANEVKSFLETEFERIQCSLKSKQLAAQLETQLDVTLPGRHVTATGHAHPLMTMSQQVEQIFCDLGFSIVKGPEVESEYYNFEALNIPADHPARDMQDTFYVEGGKESLLLRTHTSPVQIRVMKAQQPPVRIIAPGAVFRRDADITHSPMFHQIEGLYVDKGVTFGHLKGVLMLFLERLFGEGVCARFRPSFFPFTEPSAEIDIGYVRSEEGVRLAHKGDAVTDWLEILGCGMVDPEVFKAVGYNPDEVTGFAFGLGVERMAMLKWGIEDIRMFYESDMRFLEQF